MYLHTNTQARQQPTLAMDGVAGSTPSHAGLFPCVYMSPCQ